MPVAAGSHSADSVLELLRLLNKRDQLLVSMLETHIKHMVQKWYLRACSADACAVQVDADVYSGLFCCPLHTGSSSCASDKVSALPCHKEQLHLALQVFVFTAVQNFVKPDCALVVLL